MKLNAFRQQRSLTHRYEIATERFTELFQEMIDEYHSLNKDHWEGREAQGAVAYAPTEQMHKVLVRASNKFGSGNPVYITPKLWTGFSKHDELVRAIQNMHEVLAHVMGDTRL